MMERLQRAAVLLSLADRLRQNGSWCGETHLQKSAYLLKEMLKVPLDVEFVLYKHGPYSFDLTDDLARFKADGILEEEVMPYPYGPKIRPGKLAEQIKAKFPKTTAKYRSQVEFVADNLGDSKVADLEKIATALFVTKEEGASKAVINRARRLHELKPHVPLDEAEAAVERIDLLFRDSKHLRLA